MVELTEESRATLDPVAGRAVRAQKDRHDVVGRVTRRGQLTAALARLVHGALVPLVFVGRVGQTLGLQPYQRHPIVQQLRLLFCETLSERRIGDII